MAEENQENQEQQNDDTSKLAIPPELQGYFHSLREEAKKYRIELKGLKDAQKQDSEKKQADMSEVEKLSARIKNAETEVNSAKTEAQNLKIENSILKSAGKYNFIDLEPVILMAKGELAALDEVTVEAIDKALAKIAKEKSYLVKTGKETIIPSGGQRTRIETSQEQSGDEQLLSIIKNK